MVTVSLQNKEIMNIIGGQSYEKNKNYRMIYYHVSQPIDDGTLLYNTFTREIIFLNKKEFASLNENSMSEQLKINLVYKWFLIPEDTDEKTLQYLIRQKLSGIDKRLRGGKIELFTILTTTDCNARCPYCYEAGIKRKKMSEQTALDVAGYIRENGSNNVHLKWFGGEPLFNSDAIKIVCEDLLKHGIRYTSSMVSNGYLFDEHTIDEIVNLWKLNWVQITLDGTKDLYNRTKGFIYDDINAYERVLNNIQYLLSFGVKVQVRLNLNKENSESLKELICELERRFSRFQNFQIYAKPLFEGLGSPPLVLTSEERKDVYENYVEIQKIIHDKFPNSRKTNTHGVKRHHCMADNGRCIVIGPEGKLTVCEHHCEDEIVGSIYEDKMDIGTLIGFTERAEEVAECRECFFYPCCFRLKKCPTDAECHAEDRRFEEYRAREMMVDIYNRRKEKMHENEKSHRNRRK